MERYDIPKYIQLEVLLGEGELLFTLDFCVYGESEKIHATHTFDPSEISQTSKELALLLTHSNLIGELNNATQEDIRKLSELLFDELLPQSIKEVLRSTVDCSLELSLDEGLPDIPWELLHCGKTFLGLRFAIGRKIIRRSRWEPRSIRPPQPTQQVLVLGDPCSDLDAAYEEAIRIRNLLEGNPRMRVTCLTSDIDRQHIKENLRDFDIVHFAGHVQDTGQGPGWKLSDGLFTVKDLNKMIGGAPLPSLVFTNSCRSGRNEFGHLNTDLVTTFLRAGVRHYLGTYWDIPDEIGRSFAITFYQSLLKGESIGSSLLRGRRFLANNYGSAAVLWGSYVLYGDPDFIYVQKDEFSDSILTPLPFPIPDMRALQFNQGQDHQRLALPTYPNSAATIRYHLNQQSEQQSLIPLRNHAGAISSRLTNRISDLNRMVIQSIGAAVILLLLLSVITYLTNTMLFSPEVPVPPPIQQQQVIPYKTINETSPSLLKPPTNPKPYLSLDFEILVQ